MIKMC